MTNCVSKNVFSTAVQRKLYSVSTDDSAPAEKTFEPPWAKLTGRFGVIIPKQPVNISPSVATVRG